MKKTVLRPTLLACAIATVTLGTLVSTPSFAQDESADKARVLKTVKVDANAEAASEDTESYTVESSNVATGLNLSLRDIPQSVSVITNEFMKDQAMDSVTDALRSTTGVSVKAVDRGRNSLSARGFDIANYQIDGVAVVTGNIGVETANTAIYDRVEILRGATGLLGGEGNPSATVNLVRKRANSKTFVGEVDVTLGSWDHRGGTIDLTTPLNADGSVRVRAVAGKNEQDAFIDYENTENTVLYAVLDADISENTQFSIGGSNERTKRNGVYWGGLSFWFADGSRTDWDRSKTTAPKWNQWDTEETTFFTRLDHTFSNNWVVSANASLYKQDEYSNLLWAWGEPDKTTGEGMSAYPYLYVAKPEQTQFGFQATGPFNLFNRDHELTVGFTHNEYEGGWDNGGEPLSAIPEMGNFFNWDGSYARPVWDKPYKASFETRTQDSLYTAARLQVTDAFKFIVGTRLSNWELDAEAAAWTPEAYTITNDNIVTPYLGAIYDLNEQLSAYASYADIFRTQTARDRNGDYLDPLSGETYETGLKGAFFDGALNASGAIFFTQQDNLATTDEGYFVPGTTTLASYGAKGTKSKGYEFEVSGELAINWDLSLGWTHFSAKDAEDNDVAVEHPRKMLKLFSKYTLDGNWSGLSFGGGINWQSEEPRTGTNPATGTEEKVGQSSYAIANVMTQYEINKNLSLQLNLNNIFDEKYYESSWGTFTYGEPRSARLTMKYRF
ncbi:MAG: TonB-dependent siderophore receptor [Cellvibrio sp.]|uniref:TonB-dependent siderophore receptor n=1 Tax=Cellvibrio sp. TaxID=1965322 RepID=UPI0031AF001F